MTITPLQPSNISLSPAWLLFLLMTGILVGAVSLPALATPNKIHQDSPPPPSVIEIPFRFSLDGLYREAERMVPNQAGHWRGWKRHHGIDTQYRAWRGPLMFQLSGDTLSVQAHVRYWVKARSKLIGSLEVGGSCGVDEAPRQALIGLQARLAWNPDWTLRPMFRLLPPRFLDRCEMTLANIDVTPLVGRAFQQEMRNSLQQALAVLEPRLRTIRDRASRVWLDMNKPFPISDEGWLLLNPSGVAISPLFGSDNQATAHLAVALRPTLDFGTKPVVQQPPPLPPLQAFFPRAAELRFQLTLSADYALVSRLITETLAKKTFILKDRSFAIETVELAGKQQELYIKLRLSGQAAGSAEIWAEVDFDPASQAFRIKGLDYLFDPVDTDIYLLANMFYEKIHELLVDSANRLIEQEMERTRTRLEQALLNITPDGAKLDLGQIRLDQVGIRFEPERISVAGTATGPIRVHL